jgi:hypothetical protein
MTSLCDGDSKKAVERIIILQTWHDPLVAGALARSLATPGYRAGSASGYFSAIRDALIALKDTRQIPVLQEIASQYPSIIPPAMALSTSSVSQGQPGSFPS